MTPHHTAQGLASLGRHGDTMLVHMSPHEVAGLNYLAKKQGTKLTVNPDTGLPEAFSLGGFFSSLLPTLVGGGMGFAGAPLWAGIAAGAATGAVTNRKNPLMGALMGGLGGYGGMGIGDALSKTMAITNPAAAASTAGQTAMSSAVPGAIGTTGEIGGANLIGSGIAGGTAGTNAAASNIFGAMKNSGVNIADPLAQDAAKQALQTIPKTSNFSGVNMDPSSSFLKPTVFDQGYGASAIQPSGTAGGSTLLGEGRNLANSALSNQSPLIAGAMSNSPTPGFMDTFVDQLGGNSAAMKKLGLPLGGAVLGGLEPTDLYGNPIKPKEDKYDPYATLNLSNDTGLRLYAVGGTVTTGGLRDLYATTDTPANPQLSRDGYGVGRLENLARQQAMTQAQTMGYAMGGPVSFADGGDAMKLQDEITPIDQSMGLGNLSATMPPPAGQAMQANQVQNTASALSDTASSEGSIVAQVANNLRNDPNYQPKNPIEAAIVKQMKGTEPTDQGKQAQGLGSIAPSQPMAPSYNPSVAMGPTYYAGMNAPRGFADGGDVASGDLSAESAADLVAFQMAQANNPSGLYGANSQGYGITAPTRNPTVPSYSVSPEMQRSMAMRDLERQRLEALVAPSYRPRGYAHGGYLDGAGDGMSDSIPATIEGKQPARLADGEFVVPADVVSHLGNGSSKAGSKRLYAMLDKVRHARTGNKKQGKEIKPEKYMPA